VVRRPRALDRAYRRHVALYLLAYELGAGHLVLPAALSSFGGGSMLVEHAGPSFLSGVDGAGWLGRVPEHMRVTGAVLDQVTSQGDRQAKNLLLDRHGRVLLIDHDNSLNGNFASSLFFPGRSLGVNASAYGEFHDLPDHHQRVLDHVGRQSVAALARRYHLDGEDAAELRYGARLIRLSGLAGAISLRGGTFRSIHLDLNFADLPAPIVPLFRPSWAPQPQASLAQ